MMQQGMARAFIVLGLVFATMLASCGSPMETDVTGTWSGTANDGSPFSMSVTQSGANVSGSALAGGLTMAVNGTIADARWTGTMTSVYGWFRYDLAVNRSDSGSDSASGTLVRNDGLSVTITLMRH